MCSVLTFSWLLMLKLEKTYPELMAGQQVGCYSFYPIWWLLWCWRHSFHIIQLVGRRICSEICELHRLVDTIFSALAHGDSEIMKYSEMLEYQINSSMQCYWATSPSYLQNVPHPVDVFHAQIGTSIILFPSPDLLFYWSFIVSGDRKGEVTGWEGQPTTLWVSQRRDKSWV